jgi:hypothetical protein
MWYFQSIKNNPDHFSETEKTNKTQGSIPSCRRPIVSAGSGHGKTKDELHTTTAAHRAPLSNTAGAFFAFTIWLRTSLGLIKSQVWTTGGLAGHGENNSHCPRESHASQTTITTEAAATLLHKLMIPSHPQPACHGACSHHDGRHGISKSRELQWHEVGIAICRPRRRTVSMDVSDRARILESVLVPC